MKPQTPTKHPALRLRGGRRTSLRFAPFPVLLQRHSQDVLQRQQGGKVDLSRVDAMVAVRMRVTGHSQAEIEAALRQLAPTLRDKPEGRDWGDYAQRTARYAFGADGDRQAAGLGKYRQQWERLEGWEHPQQQQRKNERDVPSLGR